MKGFIVVDAKLVLCGGAESATQTAVPAFTKVVVVVLENKSRSDVLGNRAAPAFNAFARGGAVLSGYRGVTHPSLPNYLALVSGSTHGITSDCTSCTVSGRSLADTLEAKGLTWKTYAEGLPRPGWTGPYSGRYAKKHVPFLYFRRVLASPARVKRVVPLTQFTRDRTAGKLPTFSLVVPDLCHDMHDCSVATGDAWLKRFLPPLLELPGTAVFVVFDESDSASPGVPALALGTLVRPNSRVTGPTDHYSLLRTIEDGLGLPKLGRSARAVPITGIWRLPPVPGKRDTRPGLEPFPAVAMLTVLTGAIEARDPYTQGHSARVTALAEEIALRLGWSEERLVSLRLGGPLHDIGKLAVSEHVLRKEGSLEAHELAEIRKHPKAGARLILRVAALREAIPYVLYHHERWDGSGYPSGKAGEEIPLEARVLAVADAFDAMTSDRPYRRALSRAEALAEVDRCAGTQFDPEIARVFLGLFEEADLATAASA